MQKFYNEGPWAAKVYRLKEIVSSLEDRVSSLESLLRKQRKSSGGIPKILKSLKRYSLNKIGKTVLVVNEEEGPMVNISDLPKGIDYTPFTRHEIKDEDEGSKIVIR